MTVAHGEKFPDSKTSVRKFTSPVEEILTKFLEIFFSRRKTFIYCPTKKPPSLAHSLCPEPTNPLLTNTVDESEKPNCLLFLILPMFFVSYDNLEGCAIGPEKTTYQR